MPRSASRLARLIANRTPWATWDLRWQFFADRSQPHAMLSPMTTIFKYVPHPHIEARKASGPPKVAAAVAQVHGPGVFGRLNAKIGLRITIIVGTMWAAYIFAILAFVSLPSTIKAHSATVLVLWLSSEFLQLVLLPIIIVGQNIQATAADSRAEATFNDAAAILEEAKQIQAHLEAQDAVIERIVATVCH